MNALPALPAAPARAATAPETAADDPASEGGGFAAALEQAREPKASPADGAARCGSPAADKSAPKGTRSGEAKARAVREDPGEDSETPIDETTDAADRGTPDLAALLPGWPPAPLTPAATTSAAARAVRASHGQVAVDAVGEAEARRPLAAKAGERQHTAMVDGTAAPQELRNADSPAPARPVLDRPAAQDLRAMAGNEPVPTVQAIKSLAEAGITNTTAIAASTPLHMPPASNNGLPIPAAPPFEARLAAAIDTPAFAPALANQVTWLAHEGVQHARLSLNPAEMGPLAVQIVLDGTQARIDFSADLLATRAAIEASLPTLAAALHDSGLTLAGGGVSDGQARRGAPEGQHMPAPGAPTNGSPRGSDSAGPPTAPRRNARGLVDLVA